MHLTETYFISLAVFDLFWIPLHPLKHTQRHMRTCTIASVMDPGWILIYSVPWMCACRAILYNAIHLLHSLHHFPYSSGRNIRVSVPRLPFLITVCTEEAQLDHQDHQCHQHFVLCDLRSVCIQSKNARLIDTRKFITDLHVCNAGIS